MPRHIIQVPSWSPKHDRFAKKLAEEVKTPGDHPQPLILEKEISATSSRHVHVIWDLWRKLTDEERSDVIVEAYVQAEGKEYAEQITIASGLTAAESLALGLLAWKVEPMHGKYRAHSDADYTRAFLEEAKTTVLGPAGTREHGFRFARREDAEAAVKRLNRALPHAAWTVCRDVYVES